MTIYDTEGPVWKLSWRVADAFDASHPFKFDIHAIVLAYSGSRSHGLDTPESDVDLMGAILPPQPYLIGFSEFESWRYQKDDLDTTMYSFHRMVRLLASANPNVLPLLWLREEDYLFRHTAFHQIQEHRHLFATKAAYAGFKGFSNQQLRRYGTPSAFAHVARLMTMATEFLRDGVMRVHRTDDAQKYRDIKSGLWSTGDCWTEINKLSLGLKDAYEASPLPDAPDMDAVNRLVVNIVRQERFSYSRRARE